MKKLLKKYYRLNEDLKESLRNLYILNEIEKELENHSKIELTIDDEERMLNTINEIILYCNLSIPEIIMQMFYLLEEEKIDIYDIEEMNLEELITLIEWEAKENKENEKEIIDEFMYKEYYCMFVRDGEKYMIICEKDNESDVVIFNDFEELLAYIIKSKLKK